ncbi:MAG: 3'-5' exonuclease, partial [Myxococcota bacterium]|nr:3'-5' exonuclease [Myxococcota bacterium]
LEEAEAVRSLLRAAVDDPAAGDVAVLVRSHREAHAVQQALRGVGVGGVVMSRESVFASAEAWELARLLEAVAEAGDPRRLRAALSLELVGGDAGLLERTIREEAALEPVVAAFRDAHRRWREQGFMAMLMELLGLRRVPARLLARAGGERSLTNLLQLGELLQEASREHHTMESLLRWFATQRLEPDDGAEDQQLRLESDERLVQIVTVHRSKGLEYPVVLLPYLWRARPARAEPPLGFHADGAQCFDLGSDSLEAHRELAEEERMAEDLRLLYVALTRARHLCIPVWGGFNGAADSALAHLLHGPGVMAGLDDRGVLADLEALAGGVPGAIEVDELSAGGAGPAADPGAAGTGQARVFHGFIDRRWRIHSYTGLVGQQAAAAHERLGEVATAEEAGVVAGQGRTLRDFPRGARAGIFLHELLERLDFPAAVGTALEEQVGRGLDRHGFGREWLAAVSDGVAALLDTPLTEAGAPRLRDIPRGRRRDEMDFHYPLAGVDTAALTALLTGEESAPQGESALHGLMKGYVDLVFEHEGRYFIVDYKSNHLGDRPEDYRAERLDGVMADHRYDMQYRIYALALHRHLVARLPGYAYEDHFGGVFYLFLRGMAPATGSGAGVWFHRPPPDLVATLDRVVGGP